VRHHGSLEEPGGRREDDDFECPVCLEVPQKPPVYQCRNGHCVCSDCKVMLVRCPECRIFLGNIRNRTLEKLLAIGDHLQDFECPVCLRVPREAPVYQCARGHCVCSGCHEKLSKCHFPKCPVCRIALGKIRNRIFESMLDFLEHPCQFSFYRCNEEAKKSAIEVHERDCEHRLVNCVLAKCKIRIPLSMLIDHVEEAHGATPLQLVQSSSGGGCQRLHFKTRPKMLAKKRRDKWTEILEVQGRHFVFALKRSSDGQWFSWVSLVGPTADCRGFKYSVKLFSDEQEEEVTPSHSGFCTPLDMSTHEIIQDCVTFRDETVAEFIECFGGITLDLSIQPVS